MTIENKPQNTENISVLVVDDELAIRKLIFRILKNEGLTLFEATNGRKALEMLAQESFDLVITDISMPEMNGIELTQKIKQRHDVDVIMMTGYFKNIHFHDAISLGASDFIQKPFESEEFRLRLARVLRERKTRAQLAQSLQQFETVLDGVVNALSATVEARDPYTSGHQKRVASIAVSIAKSLGLDDYRVKGISMAGLLHDLGKIAIPAEILSKPGRLSEVEFLLIKKHPEAGYNILKDIEFPMPIAETVYQHHERIDGSGYPRGLRKNEILLEARILAVADVIEAMSSHRPYRPALGAVVAIEEISKNNGIIYDADVVNACLKIVNSKDFAQALGEKL